MAGIVLDSSGRPARRDRAHMYVPPGLADEEACIVGVCNVCEMLGRETVFREGEEVAWQRHVASCATANLDTIRSVTPGELHKGTVFDPDYWDPEVRAHLDGVRARMEAEDRWEMRPSERAGLQ